MINTDQFVVRESINGSYDLGRNKKSKCNRFVVIETKSDRNHLFEPIEIPHYS